MSLSVEYELCVPPVMPARSGEYDLVRETRPLFSRNKPKGRIWFNEDTGDVVIEEVVDGSRPFGVVLLDFDGLLVETESRGNVLDARRTRLMRDAGINGLDYDLEALMARVNH